jgi:hypothetical protein
VFSSGQSARQAAGTIAALGSTDFIFAAGGGIMGLARFDAEMRQGRSLLALDIVDDETLRWAGESRAGARCALERTVAACRDGARTG